MRKLFQRLPIETIAFTGGELLEKFKLDRSREDRQLVEQGAQALLPAPKACM